jgi:hypothetical protein
MKEKTKDEGLQSTPAFAKLPVSRSAFNEAAPCYCILCERTYKNYERFKKHLLKVHYNPKHFG